MNGQIIRKDSPLNVQNSNDDMYGFRLILFSDTDEMHELWLPAMPEGFFRFTDNHEHRFLSIVSQNGQWVALCKKPAFFQNVPWEQSCEVPLADRQLLQIDCSDRVYYLYVENVYKRHMAYKYCYANTDVEINIGSKSGSEIYYDNPYIAARHAVLRRISGRWSVQDCGSVFGVFVNRIKKVSGYLKTGDIVSIMGLRIIIGPNFLSVNDYVGGMTINSEILQSIDACHSGYSYYHDQEFNCQGDSYFNRLPRKRLEIAQRTISVEGPPMSIDQKQIPMILRMGSSMVMGGAAALAGNFMTLISSVMFPFLSSKYTEKQRQEYEQLRLSKYREYLSKKAKEIEIACQEEKKLLNQKYPENGTVIETVKQKTHLWERRPVDSDFLEIRLGTGTRKLTATLEYPVRRFELESDVLEEEMYQLVEQPRCIDDVPIVLPIADTRVCGLLGSRDQVISYIRQMVLQISAFHSYDEVKTVFFLNDQELEKLDEFRYLPHAWDDQRTIRYIATEEADAYKLGEHIKDQIARDKEGEQNLSKILKKRPYYLIFALDKKLFECHEVMKEIMQSGETYGISIFTAYDDLPKESQKIITLESDKKNTCTTMGVDGGKDVRFCTDYYDENEYSQAMRILANTRLKTGAQSQELPKMVTFLEMFNAGRVEQLNPLKRWQDSNPVKSLAAPVGIGTDGTLFTLDLHEKRQGPHGLIAGMTGSGKSEFIITYILSMAVNYHPDEVAFVLIDYKGGGLAGAFENPQTGVKLPHLVGTITNLDGASIQRSLMSIESELIRRQRIFNDVKSTVNEGTMDIYAYQKLYRAGRVSEPMPHLFIVSDEFAELKQQQPEFMDKLISAARIGRSLGVHLILATQKPSGVVNDQIRSNTKFRVCLRVQDRSDSMDMLKRPEAAELTDTGRFYLQVGYNEYFAMGQSAWCGAQYEPQDTVIVQKDDAVEFLDTSGQVIVKAKPKVKKTDSGMKQIVAIVKYLSDLAKTHGIQAKQLWQPELPKSLSLKEISKYTNTSSEGQFSVCLGIMDDPINQIQIPMEIDFLKNDNTLIVGNSGSGKTTFIQNMLYTLSKKLSPELLNFYILDYSSRRFKIFQKLPHCGAVLYEEDSNSLEGFFAIINEILSERKVLFSELGVDSFDLAKGLMNIPLILVIIDNFSGLTSSKKGDSIAYQLPGCTKECPNYGIKFIITCSHSNDVHSKMRQTLNTRYCLSVKDRYEYSDVLNTKVNYCSPDIPGRGVCIHDMRPLEFQAGTYWSDMNSKDQIVALNSEIREIQNKYDGHAEARHLPVVDSSATYREFASQFGKGRIPLGFSKVTGKTVALPLKQFSTLSVYFGNPQGKRSIVENLLLAATREAMEIWVVRQNAESLFENPENHFDEKLLREMDTLSSSTEDIALLQKALTGTMSQRKEIMQEFWKKENIDPESPDAPILAYPTLHAQTKPIMLLIENLADFVSSLNPILSFAYSAMFEKTNWRNIYVVACLEPNAYAEVARSEIFALFGRQNVLLFGGEFDKQQLCSIPTGTDSDKRIPFNAAIMQYQKKLYPIVMPCGPIEEQIKDQDMESIF